MGSRENATGMGEAVLAAALRMEGQQAAAVQAMLHRLERSAPDLWDPAIGEHRMIPVDGAEIRVIHIRPGQSRGARPVVFVPGWGVVPQGFQEFYAALDGGPELYYLETREKPSSRILDRRTDMSVSRSARDIGAALSAMGLAGDRDFVLVGSCWGASIILQGLIEGTLEAPTIVAIDPMHALWFPKWVLRYVAPLLPVFVTNLLKPFLRRAMIGDMKEKNQKARIERFIDEADTWKWKKSAEAARDFELFGSLARIEREIFVFNGTTDKVHDQRDYPRIARELPRGRFLYLEADEGERERLMAIACLEFARVPAAQGLPPALLPFEKPVR